MIITLLFILLTLLIYYASKRLYRWSPKVYLTPLLVTPVVIVLLLLVTHVPFHSYNLGGKWLTAMLQPATIAFAVPLYKYFDVLKKHAIEILTSVFIGALMGMLSSALIAKWLHLDVSLMDSMIPRSITTPIAMNVSSLIGGIPTVTAIVVIMTGILGSIIGPLIIRLFHIDNDLARGVLFGTGAHGAGTSKAFELSSISGTISSVSMILAALFTLCLAPLLF
ncbi:putative murein hydrolase (TIGR00659 family) [Pullulanibacillus pueri]|uniref:CidB/LrgB family autolysis modulator n=1 Tax=Pullulanibacillus pueri TaxID=1437324 RepID=A0A8J2ZV06_9BACL|nr:CidB/LrgB family autolysis modulator [Pullulanibacillus pueri]MBM7680799.1 putative murein hydrolase (TIGR00659 family) [Pullulanibacillus pueri]GGH78379.1 hypothetical protein GCM10007096_11710 [Pullulanibacillus pueri]